MEPSLPAGEGLIRRDRCRRSRSLLSPTDPAALIAVLTYGAGLVVASLWILGFLGAARSWRGSPERLPLLVVFLRTRATR